jgi:hypothetical protein
MSEKPDDKISMRLGNQCATVDLGVKITGMSKPAFIRLAIHEGSPLIIQAFRKLKPRTPKP